MKLVIYGLGKYFRKYMDDIDYSSVVGLIDSNEKLHGQEIHGIKVESQESLEWLAYDYVIIFSPIYALEIQNQLQQKYLVPKNRIIIWHHWIKEYETDNHLTQTVIGQSTNLIRENRFSSVLDLKMKIANNSILSRQDSRVGFNRDISIDAYNYKNYINYPFMSNIYDHIYSKCINKKYDVAAFVSVKDVSIEEFDEIAKETILLSRYLLINITDAGTNTKELFAWITYDYEKLGRVFRLFNKGSYIVLIDKEQINTCIDVDIYVVTHKKMIPPKDPIYIPIQVGIEKHENLGYLKDNVGVNISNLNLLINECTAMYWIWKHTDSEYVGLNHYRRYFLKNKLEFFDNILDSESIDKIMQNYDLVLPESYHNFDGSLIEDMKMSVDNTAVEQGIQLVRDIIRARHMDYLDAFDYIFSGNTFYMCNMFITSRKIFNTYCEWFFDIIIEAAERVDVSGYDAYSQRIIGFIAERLLTVWLLKTSYRIKELPIIVTE